MPDGTSWQRHDPEDLPFAEITQPISYFFSAIMGGPRPLGDYVARGLEGSYRGGQHGGGDQD